MTRIAGLAPMLSHSIIFSPKGSSISPSYMACRIHPSSYFKMIPLYKHDQGLTLLSRKMGQLLYRSIKWSLNYIQKAYFSKVFIAFLCLGKLNCKRLVLLKMHVALNWVIHLNWKIEVPTIAP